MRSLLRALLVTLTAALLALPAGASTASALMECLALGGPSGHCCCPPIAAADASPAAPCAELTRPSCCTQHAQPQAAPLPASTPLPMSVPVAYVAVTRIALVDLFAPARPAPSLAPREAPRAVGPPLLLRTLQLRI